ncbi:MAG TPA: TetR/AcrR family transcriptional regulator [Caulobacteraceae bacterium]|nr:TetR/AcrR family transcriptional regulator [Caulobacteraceae bacterium]
MTPSSSPARTPAADTVDDLLSTAERMFAELGVANVALTQIVAESGQKNRSALHYHFGSRGGVLSAVMDRRLAAINARRLALLDALPADPAAAEVVRANITALALTVVEEPWGPDYISILAQVRFHPGLLDHNLLHDDGLSSVRLARRLLGAAARGVAPAQLVRRYAWLTDAVVFELARWTRATPPAQRTADAVGALVEELTVFGTAGLLADPPTGSLDP